MRINVAAGLLRRLLRAGGLMCGLAPLLCGCGSLEQLRIGPTPRVHPDKEVVLSYTCAGQNDAARMYVYSASHAWLGPALERYLTDARDAMLAGKCPCPGESCAEKAAAAAGRKP